MSLITLCMHPFHVSSVKFEMATICYINDKIIKILPVGILKIITYYINQVFFLDGNFLAVHLRTLQVH